MKIDDPHLQIKTIDSEELIIVDDAAWEILRRDKAIDSWVLSPVMMDWASKRQEFVARYPELSLSFRRIRLRSNDLHPIILLHLDEVLQRVHLEKPICEVCKWTGIAATPDPADMYLGLPIEVKQEVWKHIDALPEVNCPRCGSRFTRNRHYVWVQH